MNNNSLNKNLSFTQSFWSIALSIICRGQWGSVLLPCCVTRGVWNKMTLVHDMYQVSQEHMCFTGPHSPSGFIHLIFHLAPTPHFQIMEVFYLATLRSLLTRFPERPYWFRTLIQWELSSYLFREDALTGATPGWEYPNFNQDYLI